jgi:hypothetical protein
VAFFSGSAHYLAHCSPRKQMRVAFAEIMDSDEYIHCATSRRLNYSRAVTQRKCRTFVEPRSGLHQHNFLAEFLEVAPACVAR